MFLLRHRHLHGANCLSALAKAREYRRQSSKTAAVGALHVSSIDLADVLRIVRPPTGSPHLPLIIDRCESLPVHPGYPLKQACLPYFHVPEQPNEIMTLSPLAVPTAVR